MIKFSIFVMAIIVGFQLICAEDSPVVCGTIPHEVYTCLGAPRLVSSEVASQCSKETHECESITCVFRKSGWLDGDKVDKVKLSGLLDQIAKDHPEWAPAVEKTKVNCLTTDLPAQGIHLNCSTYDIAACTFTNFVRNAHWQTDVPKCNRARQFATACPICTNACYAPNVPVGSCKCLDLPRSP